MYLPLGGKADPIRQAVSPMSNLIYKSRCKKCGQTKESKYSAVVYRWEDGHNRIEGHDDFEVLDYEEED